MSDALGTYDARLGLFYRQGLVDFKGKLSLFGDGKVLGFMDEVNSSRKRRDLFLGFRSYNDKSNDLAFALLPENMIIVPSGELTLFSRGVFQAIDSSEIGHNLSRSYGGLHLDETAGVPKETLDKLYSPTRSFHNLDKLASLSMTDLDWLLKHKRSLNDEVDNNRKFEGTAFRIGQTGYIDFE